MTIVSLIFFKIIFGKMTVKKKISFTLSLSFITILFVNYDKYLYKFIENVLGVFNIYSRTLALLQNETINFLNGRELLYAKTIEYININFFSGYGIYGDRALLDGTYPHNIILEFLVQYGILLGTIFLVLILLLIICGFYINEWNDISIIFVSIVIVGSMLSGSYLTNLYFWMMLGGLINAIMNKKIKLEIKNSSKAVTVK